MSKKGKNVTIKGILYEDGMFDHPKNDDIYKRGYQDYNLLLKTIEKTFNKMEGK